MRRQRSNYYKGGELNKKLNMPGVKMHFGAGPLLTPLMFEVSALITTSILLVHATAATRKIQIQSPA